LYSAKLGAGKAKLALAKPPRMALRVVIWSDSEALIRNIEGIRRFDKKKEFAWARRLRRPRRN
jgi:hypothetical protein